MPAGKRAQCAMKNAALHASPKVPAASLMTEQDGEVGSGVDNNSVSNPLFDGCPSSSIHCYGNTVIQQQQEQ